MSTGREQPNCEYLSDGSLEQFNYQQKILFGEHWDGLIRYIRFSGKCPERNKGYSKSNVRPIARRIFQVFQYHWRSYTRCTELPPEAADEFVMGLKKDNIKTNEGKNYSEGSKRKFVQALSTYFDFVDVDWSPTTVFSDNEPTTASDPFARREREELLNTALEYKCPPNYKNVSPDERDRWNTYISQHFGKNKTKIGPSDWEKLRRSWKIPSLISATLDAGLRSEMIGRLLVEYVDLDNGQIHISPETAVKNNQKWTIELSNRSVKLLRKWFDQRGLKKKYDDSNLIWLNRKGNRYESSPLNNILQNLIAEAEIKQKGRKLTWHSIRHSTGMYVYDRERDLGLVAEVLRHASLESARKYAHPTPETKTGVIESIQGGGFE